ncbi:transcriptional regulator [Streptomyces sp. C10-9-1]|uniref:transcriptional regulator n=1 Tax=Streptomyces sp. C10-9-1 TaxID=1859285 RepID=UPI003F49E520
MSTPTAAVSPTLTRLAEERATGVLVRDHGALYLADGQVVHAESPAAPGLDVLLIAGGRLGRTGWDDAVARAGARREVGRFLVDSGQVTGGELELCHLAALHDAAFFTLAPAGGPTRFRYGVAHWMGSIRPVPAADVAREASRRRGLLEALWPYPGVDTAPLRPAPASPGASRRQQALLALADGVRTPPAIARVIGRPAFNTLVEVRRMAAAGLVETPPDPACTPRARLPDWVPDFSDDPDIALLRRLRDALEASL